MPDGGRVIAGTARSIRLDAPGPADNEPLDTPLDEEFRVGTLGLAFDVDTATVVIEAVCDGPAVPLSGRPAALTFPQPARNISCP